MATKPAPKKYSRRSAKERFDVFEHVNERIQTALDNGVAAWRKPWKSSVIGFEPEAVRNAITGRPYRGINVLLLNLTAMSEGYEDPRWLTFKQAAARAKAVWLKANGHKDDEAGEAAYVAAVKDGYRGGVRKGEKSTIVTLWKPFAKEVTDDATGEKKQERFLLLKHYYVFNVEQCDGLDLPTLVEQPDAEPEEDFSPIEAAEAIVAEMPQRPRLVDGRGRAYYSPMMDHVGMPKRESFKSEESFYATLFHELVHSTGHSSRTGRVKDWTTFGSEPYAQEELVAEMGAAFLCGMVGIDSELDQSAAYIASWAKKVKEATDNDKRWLVNAASRAQKAADFILGVKEEQAQEKPQEAPEAALVAA